MPDMLKEIVRKLFRDRTVEAAEPAKTAAATSLPSTFAALSATAQIDGHDPRALEAAVPRVRTLEERILIATRCRDADVLPRAPNAGAVVEEADGTRVQIMHNGIRVVAGGYYGDWMQELIQRCRGVHEPQEEVLFAEVVKHLPDDASMLELGGYWSFYSVWFQHGAPRRRSVVVEPDPVHIEVGRANARLNGCAPIFVNAFVGGRSAPPAPFATERSGTIDLPCVSVPDLMATHGIDRLDLLHCDTQGAELTVIESCATLAAAGRLRWLVVSTHVDYISGDPLTHQRCLATLRAMGAVILAEHDVHESFSGDGLILAKFGAVPPDWRTPALSYNRYSESLFRNPLYDLAEARARKAAETPLPPDVGLLVGNPFFARRGTLVEITADGDFGTRGETMVLPHDGTIFPTVLQSGGWARDMVDFYADHMDPDQRYTLVDIGANIGLFSRQCAYRFPNIDRFVCVEPDPGNFQALRYNLGRAAGTRAELFNVALSDADGEAEFFRDVENIGNYSLADDAMRDRSFAAIKVSCVATDRWMREGLKPGPQDRLLWKSDTQGYDELIISRTPMDIWRQVHCASIEVWRIRKPAFDWDAFAARVEDFPHKALGTGNPVTTADVLAYLDNDDWTFTDLYLWR